MDLGLSRGQKIFTHSHDLHTNWFPHKKEEWVIKSERARRKSKKAGPVCSVDNSLNTDMMNTDEIFLGSTME